MKLKLKDEPKEWRKSTVLSTFGLALITSLLRWRHVLGNRIWLAFLSASALLIILAILRPRAFRGYHLFSMRLGFAVSQFLGRVLLVLFFLFILTPTGWILRLIGKDALQLKRPSNSTTHWRMRKTFSPLDRLF